MSARSLRLDPKRTGGGAAASGSPGVLLRWRSRIAWRALRAHAFGTLEGRVLVVIALISLPSAWRLAAGGAVLARPWLTGDARWGALVLSHALLALCYAVTVPTSLLRTFVLDGNRNPLQAHPWVLPMERVLTVAGALLWPALYLWTFYYLLLARLLTAEASSPAGFLAIHFLAGTTWLVTIGVAVAGSARPALTRLDLPRRARRIQRLAILPFLASFALFASLPLFLAERAPDLLARIGESAAAALYVGQAPVALLAALEGGRSLVAVAWGIAILAPGAFAVRGVWRWREVALQEIPLDLHPAGRTSYRPGFSSRRWWTHPLGLLGAFWTKDVALPLRRSPLAYLQGSVPALATVGMTAAVALTMDARGLPPATTAMATRLGLLIAIGWIVGWHALGSLGHEGRVLGLLRTRLTPARLLGLKIGVAVPYIAIQAVGLGAILLLTLRVLGIASSGPGLLVDGVAYAIPIATLGTSIGFLLPGLRSSGGGLAGVSGAAKLLFPPIAIAGAMGSAALPPLVAPVVLMAAAGAIGWLGVRRLDALES